MSYIKGNMSIILSLFIPTEKKMNNENKLKM